MKLRAIKLNIETGKKPYEVVISEKDISNLPINPGDRVKVVYKGKEKTAIVEVSNSVEQGIIWIYKELWDELNLKMNEYVKLIPLEKPKSIEFIKRKLKGYELEENEIYEIIKEIVDYKLSEKEITLFVAAIEARGMSREEMVSLTKAMVNTGETLELNKWPILNKHGIGGIAGNKVSMVLVPIVASLNYYIPKTSSRSITSDAGTADAMEVLAPVEFEREEIYEIIEKTKGCIVWGGSPKLNMVPADSIINSVERIYQLDPIGIMVGSILSKKKACSSTHIVMDIPYGPEAKVPSQDKGLYLLNLFKKIGKRLKMYIDGYINFSNGPVGRGIGPALSAREALYVLKRDKRRSLDLEEKSVELVLKLLNMIKNYSKASIYRILDKGLAWNKMKEIIEMQGGDVFDPDEIQVGKYKFEIVSKKNGVINSISNKKLIKLARILGAPGDKQAGVYLNKIRGEYVKSGETLYTLYANKESRIDYALKYIKENPIYEII